MLKGSSNSLQKGFTLVELAVVTLIISVITAGFVVMAKSVITQQQQQRVAYETATLIPQLVDFAQRNNRLPCPDSDGDGVENCGSTGTGFPFNTILLSKPAVSSIGGAVSYIVSPDLIALSNIDDPQWKFSATNRQDFCRQLTNSLIKTLTVSEPAIVSRGSSVCSVANVVANPAVIIVDSGSTNADGAGNVFDGLNGSGFCYSSPAQPQTANYDDTVLVLGKALLAGDICS